MGDNFADKSADIQKKIENDIAKESEKVNSIEQAVFRSIALSWDTVMEHAVKPKIAELFKPSEARKQGYSSGKDAFARLDDDMDKLYADC
jgi:hypothetical protein